VLHSTGLTIVANVAIATGPVLFGGPLVLCVKFFFMICKGEGWIEFRCPKQTFRKGPYISHMRYKNFIRWKQV